MRLLLTDNAASAHRQRLRSVSEHVDVVRLSELEGAGPTPIDAAFFSPDCSPDLAAAFMVAVLEAPGLSWLHTFSAGTDHPIFATLIDRGVRVTNSSGGSAVPISHAVVMSSSHLTSQHAHPQPTPRPSTCSSPTSHASSVAKSC